MCGKHISFAEAYFIRGSVFHARECISFYDVGISRQLVAISSEAFASQLKTSLPFQLRNEIRQINLSNEIYLTTCQLEYDNVSVGI